MCCQSAGPSDGALENHNIYGPFKPQFPFYCSDCGDARGIEKAENKHRDGIRQRHCRRSSQNIDGRNDAFLGNETADERCYEPPVPKSERSEYRTQKARNTRQHTVLALTEIEPEIEGLQGPDYNRRQENDGKCALEEVLGLIPKQERHILYARHPVVRQFHNERGGIVRPAPDSAQEGHKDSDQNSSHIEAGEHKTALAREECVGKEGVNRDFRGATHIRSEQYGSAPVPR